MQSQPINLIFVFCLLLNGFQAQAQSSVDVVQAFKELQIGEAVVIDIRDSVGIGSEIVAGASWVRLPATTNQLPDVFDKIARCIPPGQKVYLYCYVGSFAGLFADGLKSRGVNAFNAGGFNEWESQNIPLMKAHQLPINQVCPFN
jgi:rhodanese-related sulfurtransferase